MNQLAKYLIGAAVLAAAFPVSAQSVRDISDKTLNSAALIMPESAETDTKAMLENWYLKNYAVIDYDADNADSGDLSDEVIIERLGKLPTVIEMPFNSVVKNTIRFYANRKQLVENMLGLSLYYNPIFVEALERNGMPLELKYLPVIESALVIQPYHGPELPVSGSLCPAQRQVSDLRSAPSSTSAGIHISRPKPPQDTSNSFTTLSVTGRLLSRPTTAVPAM